MLGDMCAECGLPIHEYRQVEQEREDVCEACQLVQHDMLDDLARLDQEMELYEENYR